MRFWRLEGGSRGGDDLLASMSIHEHIYRSGRTNTDRDGGREIRPWWGRVNTAAAVKSQQLWMRLLHETLNASVARHKALLSSFRGQGMDGDNRKASPGHNSLTVNSVHLFT